MISSLRNWLTRTLLADNDRTRTRRSKRGRNTGGLQVERLEARELLDSGGAASTLAAGHLTYGSGLLINSVKIQPIFLQDSVTSQQVSAAMQTQFVNFFTDITSNAYIPSLLAQYDAGVYNIGTGAGAAVDNSVLVTPFTNNYHGTGFGAVDDSQIETIIDQQIAAGNTAASNPNNLYFVFAPPQDVVTAGGGDSITGFGGYHTAFKDSKGHFDSYAVIPYAATPNNNAPRPSTFGYMTIASSHEMSESITDPLPPKGWVDNTNGGDGGEVGDHAAADQYTMDGYAVQNEWSNNLKGVAHASGAGANDLFINQISPPAVSSWTGGPVATFTDTNKSLPLSNYIATVGTYSTSGVYTAWTASVTGANGYYVVNATPPGGLGIGTVGAAFQGYGSGLEVDVKDNANGGFATRMLPFTVNKNDFMTYNADSSGVAHNFGLQEFGTNYDLYDNGNLVMTQPIANTTAIFINADPGGTVDSSLTVDESFGQITVPVQFDGGNGAGVHSLTIQGGTFTNEVYQPTGVNSGGFSLDSAGVHYNDVTVTTDLNTATNFTVSGTNFLTPDTLSLTDGPMVSGFQTMQWTSATSNFAPVTFANKTNVIEANAPPAETYVVNSSKGETGLATLAVNGGAAAGAAFDVENTPAAVTTSITSAGINATINIGNASSMQGILGTLNLTNTAGRNNVITLDDSADASARTITLNSGAIQGIAPATINYLAAQTLGLRVAGGSASNLFNVQSVGSGFAALLQGGSGNDVFNVYPQAAGTNLAVDGQAFSSNPPGNFLVYNGPGTVNPGSPPTMGTITSPGFATLNYKNIQTINNGADLALSTVSISPSTIGVGGTSTVTLTARDYNGNQETSGGLSVNFGLGVGTATGTFGPITDHNNGTYTIVFTATGGGTNTVQGYISAVLVTSAPPTITVDVKPAITTQPNSQTVASGTDVTFTAAASGTPAPTVQWKISTNGGASYSNITGATSPSLTLTNVLESMTGYKYEAVFTNFIGKATTNAAVLTVNSPPVITTQPNDQTVIAGNNATFTAAATGIPLPTVQWMVSMDSGVTFNPIGGATSTTLTINAATQPMSGNEYEAVFTNPAGTATTTIANLTVNTPPSITTQPNSQTITGGNPVTFTAGASGSPAPTVQWMVSMNNGSTFFPIVGQTSTTLTFTTTAAMNGNEYDAVFTNVAGVATTNAATLTVNTLPVVTTQPQSQTLAAGNNVTFTAAATGSPVPTVQWQVSTDGVHFSNIVGATSLSLTLNSIDTSMNGNEYEAVFTNAAGAVPSNPATLTVTTGPFITGQPSDLTVTAGNIATFSASVNGTPDPTVQWLVSIAGGSFNPIVGATSNPLTFPATFAMNGNEYEGVFTNTFGSVTTTAATLTVNTVPTITTQPINQGVTAGNPVTFTAAATASPAPTVQWQVSSDGGFTFSNIAGATSTTLTFSATAAMSGNEYDAVFTNTAGSTTTNAATLTVEFAPIVTINPNSQVANAGSAVTFTAAANGMPAPTVQWMVSSNGGTSFSNITGATSTSLTIDDIGQTMTGYEFEAAFTNVIGGAMTSAATLTVYTPPSITVQPQSQTLLAGSSVTFTAAASATPAPTEQWLVSTNGGFTFTPIGGATSTTLTLNNITQSMSADEYEEVFTNPGGSTTTAAATLTVTTAPVVTTQPQSATASAASFVSFTAAASGSPAPKVQWQVSANGGAAFTNISGATSATLFVSATAALNGNEYQAVFSNVAGIAVTSAATLTVPQLTTITSTTVSGGYTIGGTIDVTASFSEPATLAGGNLTIHLNDGGLVTIAPFTNAMTVSGTYTVALGENTTALDSMALTLAAGATLKDAKGYAFTLAVPAGQSLANNAAIAVDTQPPTLTPISPQTVVDGGALLFTIPASTNIRGVTGSPVPLTYRFGATPPPGASIDPQSGVFTWKFSEWTGQTPGVYTVSVIVSVSSAPQLTTTETFIVTLAPSSTNQGSGLPGRTTVADGLAQSATYYTNFLNAAYEKYLGRTPDATGLAYWVNRMQQGLSDEHLEASFIGSAEYIQNHGGAGQQWIQSLYQDLFGRDPSAQEVQYWLNKLSSGFGPADVAYGFAASQERESQRVQADYQQFLGRSASAAEVAGWVNFFLSGGSNEQVIAGFVSSQEYFQTRGDNNVVDWLFASYRDILQQNPDVAGYNFWEPKLL